MDGHPLLEARELSVRRGDTVVLDAVNAAFGAGEWVALIGAQGAGKSTLLGALAGEVKPCAGEVFALGARLTGAAATRHGVVRLEVQHETLDATLAQLERALRAGDGSAGAQQTPVVPRVLLVDEPNASLDTAAVVQLDCVLRRLHDEAGTTVIRAATALPPSMREIDRVIVLQRGAKVADGMPREVSRQLERAVMSAPLH